MFRRRAATLFATCITLLALSTSSAVAQQPVLPVGFSQPLFHARAPDAPPLPNAFTAPDLVDASSVPSARLGRAVFASALLGALGAFGGGALGAHLDPDGEAVGSVFAGAVAGAWVGGALGGSATTQAVGPAMLGSAVGLLPGIAMVEVGGSAGFLLGPLAHGLVVALFAELGR